jgi:hypothetical protein
MKLKIDHLLLLIVLLTSCTSNNNFSKDSQEIGAWGPMVLNTGKIAGAYSISPENNPETKIDVSIIQTNNQIFFYPIVPLEIGDIYQLFETGNPKPVVKNLSVREPCVAYLGSPDGNSEIWKKCPGQDPVQITKTEGKVGDMTVSRSGEWIFFIVNSEVNKSEIWQVSPDGSKQKIIYECSGSQCSNLDYCPLTGRLAFIQDNNRTQIRILDLITEKINELEGSGTDLKFSPNGQYLSFFDESLQQLTIVNLSTQKRITKKSGSGLVGEWSRDSQTILFGEFEFWGGIPGVKVHELYVDSDEVDSILNDPNQELEFYQPMYSREEDVYMVSIRQRDAGPSKQLWLIREGAESVKQITNDPLYHYSFPSWNSDYSELVFQRYPINTSDGHSQVVVWNQSSDSFQVIADNASKPFWLP